MDKERPNPVMLDYASPAKPVAHYVPLYRKVMCGALLAAGVVMFVLAIVERNSTAGVDAATLAFGFVGCGIILPFQKVRVFELRRSLKRWFSRS